MLRKLRKLVTGLCLGLILSLATTQILPAQNPQPNHEARVKEIIDGTQVFIQNQQAKVNDVAKARQRVRTGEARAELTFDTGAVARLSRNSILTVGQCARLQRGTILVNGAMAGCTTSIVAAVRGTTYVLEVDEAGKQEIKVLEGEVIVRRENVPDFAEETKQLDQTSPNLPSAPERTQPPRNLPPTPTTETRPLRPLETRPADRNPPVLTRPASPEVVLKAGDKLEVDVQGIFSAIQKLSQAEFEGLLRGALFQGFTEQLASINQIRSSFEGLFPGVGFPINIPSIPSLPSIPRFF